LAFETWDSYVIGFGGGQAELDLSELVTTDAEDEAVTAQLLGLAMEYDPYYASLNLNAGIPDSDAKMEDGRPFLIIGSTDYTASFAACMEQTGFTPPEQYIDPDPRDETKAKQVMFDAVNQWLECARANGLPDLAEPMPAVADGWMTRPIAVLPYDIAEEQLRDLLEVCPAADPQQAQQAFEDWAVNGGTAEEYQTIVFLAETGVQIGFDYPGWNGKASESSGYEIDPAIEEHLRRLDDIIGEAKDGY
jgi:hypothetical protein